ncbi:RAMP superfamily CRISPR-associated protein [Thermomonospora amylolytica]|uniref:RAMP superfamily CRISPR-associated protein n=1 Tax=Thermomonospora amylolytica TaxID=1411117 RepID=UPI000E6C62A6|nr:RAMP superfamily CRISPR-associated protein [Thermomonospora amylolytica]
MIAISLTLRMLSDWHIGTGTAAHGHISRRVLRDEHGLPYVPAKTLNGVWRDACEVAAHALDSGPAGIWHDWVEYLFGSQPAYPGEEATREPDTIARHPRPAALLLRGPLCLPGELGPVLAGRKELRDAVTFVRPGVAIDARTGTAAEDKLRFDEMARGGLSLVGRAELPDSLNEGELGCALALLWAGAALVEGIGAKRRRGAGRCRLEPSGPGMPPSPQRLEALVQNPVPPPEPDEPDGPARTDAPQTSGPQRLRADGPGDPDPVGAPQTSGPGWERALLRMELVTPLIAHDRTIGNAVQGRDHAPGWMLLREVLRRLDSQVAHAAVRRGDLVVTPATPMVDDLPGGPRPGCWRRARTPRTGSSTGWRAGSRIPVRSSSGSDRAISRPFPGAGSPWAGRGPFCGCTTRSPTPPSGPAPASAGCTSTGRWRLAPCWAPRSGSVRGCWRRGGTNGWRASGGWGVPVRTTMAW